MSTNYYLRSEESEVHIGKLSSKGAGKGRRFVWAMSPVDLAFMLSVGIDARTCPVEGDEDGLMLITLMIKLHLDDVEHDFSQIGQRFS